MRRGATSLAFAATCACVLACHKDVPPLPNSVPGPSYTPLSPQVLALLTPPPPDPSAVIPLSPRAAASLAADVAKRVEAARSAPDRPKRVIPVAGMFVLADGDDAARLDAAVDLTQRLVNALSGTAFAHPPAKGTTVWIYGTGPFFEQGVRDHTHWYTFRKDEHPGYGMYEEQTRTIVVRTDTGGPGDLGHEIVHVLAESDFRRAPIWLGEGVPSLAEVPVFSKGPDGRETVRFGAHFRLQTLRDVLAGHDPDKRAQIRLESLFAMRTFEDFHGGPEYLHYASARELCRFLFQRGQLWDFWRAARDSTLEDPTANMAFKKVTGKMPAEMTDAFFAWVQSKQAEGT
jgi:hypothetical protein